MSAFVQVRQVKDKIHVEVDFNAFTPQALEVVRPVEFERYYLKLTLCSGIDYDIKTIAAVFNALALPKPPEKLSVLNCSADAMLVIQKVIRGRWK